MYFSGCRIKHTLTSRMEIHFYLCICPLKQLTFKLKTVSSYELCQFTIYLCHKRVAKNLNTKFIHRNKKRSATALQGLLHVF